MCLSTVRLRAEPHKNLVSNFKSLINELSGIEKREEALLTKIAKKLLAVGKPVEITGAVVEQALFYQDTYQLSHQDVGIYAAIIADLGQRTGQETKCFTSRNWKDFSSNAIKVELNQYNCRYIARFEDCLNFIQNQLP